MAHSVLAVVLDGGAHRVLEDLKEDVVEMSRDVHAPEMLEHVKVVLSGEQLSKFRRCMATRCNFGRRGHWNNFPQNCQKNFGQVYRVVQKTIS